jgi:NAD-dependent dihydropyrimidine dehydrogenase PreA subunit
MKGFQYLRNVATLRMKQERCIGCGKCLEVCPHQVFVLTAQKAQPVAFDACMECGACARNCPANALQVDAGVGCAAGLITEWLRDRKLLKVKQACC